MSIQEKENLYLLAKKLYYEGNPIMSDFEFDLLEDELKSLDSQIIKIVGSQNLKDAKYHHPSKMLSLSKIQVLNNEDLPITQFNNWVSSNYQNLDIPLEITPKFDGSSCNLVYESGKLQWALTRGDKFKGQDIISKMKLIVPEKININDKVEIRGEVVIPTEVFNKKYAKIYKNPRNFVAGILGRDEVDAQIISDFHFIAFECRIHTKSDFYHHPHTLQFLEENQFRISSLSTVFKAKNFKEIYSSALDYRINQSPYQLDGMVIKFPEYLRNQIGETDYSPKWAIAIKFPPKEAITTIKTIEWSPGLNGEFTPIATLEPIELDGTTVSNVNLHNYGNVIRQGLFPGAQVIIVKSGDIIPIVQKVIKSVDGNINNFIPQNCQSVDCKIEVQNKIHLVCTNSNCKHKKLNRLGRGISVFGLRNVASSTVKKLFEAGIQTIEDVFNNEKFNELNLIKSGQFKKGRQLEILLESRNNPTKKITLPLIITALSFENVGWSTAIQISKIFESKQSNWSGLNSSAYSPFLNHQSFEYQSVINFIEILKTNGFVIYTEEESKITEASILFELTGSPKDFGFKTKEEFINLIKSKGYVHTGLDKNTRILITDDINSSSSKMAKAKKLGVEIKTYEDILKSIK